MSEVFEPLSNGQKLSSLKEFKNMSPEQRIEKYAKVIVQEEGKNIVFNFHGDRNVYLFASAGNMLTSEIQELVTSDGKVWLRENNNGEFFFNGKNRLIIGSEGNKVSGVYSEVFIPFSGYDIQDTNKGEYTMEPEKNQKLRHENYDGNELYDDLELSDVTVGNINHESLKNLDEIIFDFHGNNELYKQSTAGKLIPSRFNYLKTGSIIWSRGKNGEFYNGTKRLIIGDHNKAYRGIAEVTIIGKKEFLKESAKNMSYEKFKGLTKEERFSLVVIGENGQYIEWSDIVSGKIKEVTFKFPNKEISRSATAGECIPLEIRSIVDENNKERRRLKSNIKGEFLDDNFQRLVIGNGTKITIGEIIPINKMKDQINNNLDFIESDEYIKEIQNDIYKLARENKIPENFIFMLLKGENPTWNYLLKVPGKNSTSYGLMQINNDTWKDIIKREKLPSLDRHNYSDQLIATIKQLVHIHKVKGGDWISTLAYYHTGYGILDKKEDGLYKKDNKYIQGIASGNPAVVRELIKIQLDKSKWTALDYFNATKELYKNQKNIYRPIRISRK